MKKISKIAIAAVVFFVLHPAATFAQKNFQPNNQKIWSVDSEVHQYLKKLYLNEGLALPSSAGPWSTAELKMWLYEIDSDNLSLASKIIYEKVENLLCKEPRFILDDTLGLSVTNTVNPEFYVHTNPTEFSKEDDWEYSYEERQPIFNMDFEIFGANNFYFLINTPINWASYSIDGESSDPLYQPIFMSNVPFLPNRNIGDISVNFPTRAISSVGADHWNLSFGRDVVRWGNGISGNLAVGGNQLFDNYMQYALFYPKYKFNFLTIFYPHEINIENNHGQNSNLTGLKFLMAHRMEGRFLNGRLDVSLGEAIMYQSASSSIDVRYFNPAGIFHNYYIRGNANSLLTFDTDFTIIPGLNLYTQILLDDLAFIGEPSEESEEPSRPSKMGYMVGTKYQLELPQGILNLYAEGVYADPCTYLREEYDSTSQTQGVSFYGHLREFLNGYETIYLRKCIGYKYGGDCISGTLNTEYDSLDKLKVDCELFYLAHGIMYNPIVGDWIRGKRPKTPSTEDKTFDIYDESKKATNDSGEVEHFFRLSTGVSYDILPQFSVNAAVDNWFIWNKNNEKKGMVYDMQVHFGVKYVFLKN